MKNLRLLLLMLCTGFGSVQAAQDLVISSPEDGDTVSGVVPLSVRIEGTLDVDSITFVSRPMYPLRAAGRVQSRVHGIDDHAPYTVSVDTTRLPDGDHLLYACANMDISARHCTYITVYVDNGDQAAYPEGEGDYALPAVSDMDETPRDEIKPALLGRKAKRRLMLDEGADTLLRLSVGLE